MANGLTHFDKEGNAVMVDVSEKNPTSRTALAEGKIQVNREVMDAILHHTVKKGDVLGVARVAGIMAVKQTSSLIPMCHVLPISKCSVDFEIEEEDKRAYQASGSRSSVLILGKHLSGDTGTGGWGDGEEAGGV